VTSAEVEHGPQACPACQSALGPDLKRRCVSAHNSLELVRGEMALQVNGDPNLPPTNNDAERALRHAVIARRISYGTRTDEGSRFYAAGLRLKAARVISILGRQRRSTPAGKSGAWASTAIELGSCQPKISRKKHKASRAKSSDVLIVADHKAPAKVLRARGQENPAASSNSPILAFQSLVQFGGMAVRLDFAQKLTTTVLIHELDVAPVRFKDAVGIGFGLLPKRTPANPRQRACQAIVILL